ncbi:MAG: hypothetical protein WCD79_20855 [Chthoniobacteraceae bacterium]
MNVEQNRDTNDVLQGGGLTACKQASIRVLVRVMTAEQILDEIKALPPSEREKLFKSVKQLGTDEIPADFLEALDDFANGRFVSMETALNETPPGQ